ncbi:oxepin-CoA hydrolase/3-oxo-5,6-dehydrosuberyl-CoA semialdehyde dehydrogenase [Hymenobacter luteus]|uniref:Oxepin-CoA hydrolase/3-oxo-5,6-dehydrosuberyl-CoA semialdehyde dehydrogenase n=2 Tax=Hymenobacter TaxID=89966 RepID=A0A7W9T3W7_9BACT|nr:MULTISPECIES: phenylacetic acid degradation bifunctional protein PaaZ [Hymenobacter]MBB4603070.1 oxepin-CoA hydrolase/3-oxo-5,6-dehydrosuberyl-CoA semialdehyde dehydrogenase [Hymenobacter latericoloratus]MBB6060971.1 oxepin-CoA hydrolase/3-oxo-5,6-dehydrosuberyl-CoA semialdehyde dehydrogenase [Hymenobacter luteus]
MTPILENYALGRWMPGTGEQHELHDASTGEVIAIANGEGLDFASMLDYARRTGNPALRKMTFHERGRMIKALALHLDSKKEDFYTLSYRSGATRADSWIDIEGGIGNLFANASLRRKFPDKPFYVESDPIALSKAGNFMGHHILVPKEGVAVHINAYNFPIWGMLEKIAVNLLAGMPAIIKPAVPTAYLTEAVVREIIASNILPEGALQLVCGTGQGILDHVTYQDVVTFTGSAETGRKLRAHPRIIAEAVPFTMEADSLNAAVLGPDAVPGTVEFDLFIKEIRKEMTAKAGQKCTAIRRAIVPENLLEDVQIALGKALGQTTVGHPQAEGVRMGALVNMTQANRVREQVRELAKNTPIVYGDLDNVQVIGGDCKTGAFMSPIVLLNPEPFKFTDSHEVEAFGPVATLMPYKNLDEAITLANMGKGSLVCSVATNDPRTAQEFVLGAATHHGRILVINEEVAKESTGHGSPLPLLIHGGPGRAGGGQEMGGMRGVEHFMQRVAIQGSPSMITAITEVYQPKAKQTERDKHPFQHYFEELEIGQTYTTHRHTVTESDITNFAQVSGDNFYAHVDATSLEGTLFTGRVAHGYYILSKAAGMFVDPRKGPVLLNYGLDECRFTKPVYPGMTIGVKLTVKEKIGQEKRDAEDVAKGIVRWLVDVSDETGETVAVATILTMVKKKNQE